MSGTEVLGVTCPFRLLDLYVSSLCTLIRDTLYGTYFSLWFQPRFNFLYVYEHYANSCKSRHEWELKQNLNLLELESDNEVNGRFLGLRMSFPVTDLVCTKNRLKERGQKQIR